MKKEIIGIVFVSLLIIVLAMVGVLKNEKLALGNVSSEDACVATSTSPFLAGQAIRELRVGSGVLCSVIITSTNTAFPIAFYDATTTDITKRNNVATSSIMITSFPGGATVGNYPFNVQFTNGLIMEGVGTAAGTTTVTYKGL